MAQPSRSTSKLTTLEFPHHDTVALYKKLNARLIDWLLDHSNVLNIEVGDDGERMPSIHQICEAGEHVAGRKIAPPYDVVMAFERTISMRKDVTSWYKIFGPPESEKATVQHEEFTNKLEHIYRAVCAEYINERRGKQTRVAPSEVSKPMNKYNTLDSLPDNVLPYAVGDRLSSAKTKSRLLDDTLSPIAECYYHIQELQAIVAQTKIFWYQAAKGTINPLFASLLTDIAFEVATDGLLSLAHVVGGDNGTLESTLRGAPVFRCRYRLELFEGGALEVTDHSFLGGGGIAIILDELRATRARMKHDPRYLAGTRELTSNDFARPLSTALYRDFVRKYLQASLQMPAQPLLTEIHKDPEQAFKLSSLRQPKMPLCVPRNFVTAHPSLDFQVALGIVLSIESTEIFYRHTKRGTPEAHVRRYLESMQRTVAKPLQFGSLKAVLTEDDERDVTTAHTSISWLLEMQKPLILRQMPWTAWKMTGLAHYCHMEAGTRLLNVGSVVAAAAHMYNVLRHYNIIPALPAMEAICDRFCGALFMDDKRPTQNFYSIWARHNGETLERMAKNKVVGLQDSGKRAHLNRIRSDDTMAFSNYFTANQWFGLVEHDEDMDTKFMRAVLETPYGEPLPKHDIEMMVERRRYPSDGIALIQAYRYLNQYCSGRLSMVSIDAFQVFRLCANILLLIKFNTDNALARRLGGKEKTEVDTSVSVDDGYRIVCSLLYKVGVCEKSCQTDSIRQACPGLVDAAESFVRMSWSVDTLELSS